MDKLTGHGTENPKQRRKTVVLCVTVTKELREEIESAVASGIATNNSELIRTAVVYYLSHVKHCPPTYMNGQQRAGNTGTDAEAYGGNGEEFGEMVLPGRW